MNYVLIQRPYMIHKSSLFQPLYGQDNRRYCETIAGQAKAHTSIHANILCLLKFHIIILSVTSYVYQIVLFSRAKHYFIF